MSRVTSGSGAGGEPIYVPPRVASHRNRTLAIVVIVIVAVAAVAGAYFLGVFGSSRQAWLFDGAYGTYSGETTYLTVTFNYTIRVQVINYNSTYVETLDYYTIKYGAHTDTNQTTHWHVLTSNGGINFAQPTEYALSGTYSTTRYVSGDTYSCTAYVYTKGGNTLTMFVSNSVGFPVEFTYSAALVGGKISIDLPIVQSNISGL
jgi:hypothetical protein